jgi:hypothetical protein
MGSDDSSMRGSGQQAEAGEANKRRPGFDTVISEITPDSLGLQPAAKKRRTSREPGELPAEVEDAAAE